MNPVMPQPDPLPLPAPPELLWGLLVLTFFLHLVPMNLLVGGSILGAIARVRARGGNRPHEAELAHVVAKALPVVFAAAVSMGVAALLFLQVLYGRAFFVSSVLMGWWWLAVILLLVLAYYGSYLLSMREGTLGPRAVLLAWLVAAVVGLVALIYGNNMTLMLRPDLWQSLYFADGRGTALNLSDATLLPRHLHMVLGAIAVAGLGVAVLGVMRTGSTPGFGRWAVRTGAAACGGATALNVFAGLWWLAALPRDVLLRFMGQDMAAVIVLLAGIGLTFTGAALLVFGASRDEGAQAPFVWSSAGTLLAGLVTMILTRDTVRTAALGTHIGVSTWVMPQWGPIVVFAVLLVVALGSVGWMVVMLRRSHR
jgi:hypothetical protein